MPQQIRAPGRSSEIDRHISARLRARDDSALRQLYEEEGARLLVLTVRLLGDHALAEDVIQDVFATLWFRPDVYEPDRGSLRGWLSMRCRGRAIDHIRSRVARDLREQFVQVGEASCHDDDHDSLERRLILEWALEALSPDDQRFLHLAFFTGLSYRETAELIGIPEGTAKTRFRRILTMLRRHLATPSGSDSVDAPHTQTVRATNNPPLPEAGVVPVNRHRAIDMEIHRAAATFAGSSQSRV